MSDYRKLSRRTNILLDLASANAVLRNILEVQFPEDGVHLTDIADPLWWRTTEMKVERLHELVGRAMKQFRS